MRKIPRYTTGYFGPFGRQEQKAISPRSFRIMDPVDALNDDDFPHAGNHYPRPDSRTACSSRTSGFTEKDEDGCARVEDCAGSWILGTACEQCEACRDSRPTQALPQDVVQTDNDRLMAQIIRDDLMRAASPMVVENILAEAFAVHRTAHCPPADEA